MWSQFGSGVLILAGASMVLLESGCAAGADPSRVVGPTGGAAVDDKTVMSGGHGADLSTTGGVAAAPGGGSTSPTGGNDCPVVTETAQNTQQPADIVWVVDNGGSIQGDIDYIRMNINRFSQDIVAAGIDAHIVMITDAYDPDVVSMATPVFGGPAGDWRSLCVGAPLGSGNCPNDTDLPNFLHVDHEVGPGHDLIPIAGNTPANVIVSRYEEYKHVLRREATKAFIVMTESDAVEAPENSAAAFTQNVLALDGGIFEGFKFHGVIGSFSHVYRELITQTGGALGDLNAQDFDPVFDAISKGVIQSSELACEWTIPPVPEGKTFEKDKVNVVFTADGTQQSIGKVKDSDATLCTAEQLGWRYDDEAKPSLILACPQTCTTLRAAKNASLDIQFGCRTRIIALE